MRVRGPKSPTAFSGGALSWLLTCFLALLLVFDPYAASAVSPLRLHGAMVRESDVGIVGHRGSASSAPENTLASFGLAIEQGVDFLETDVQLTADGVPVLMHDPKVDRTTDGSGPLRQYTLQRLRALDAGSWFAPEFAGEPVPTLEEFADLLVSSVSTRAFIELKGDWDAERIAAAIDLLRSRGLSNRTVLASFERDTLDALHRSAPEFATILLTRELDESALDFALDLQVSAVCARDTLLHANRKALERLHEAGIGLVGYTLNTPEQWEAADAIGLDYFVTDDPVALAAWRDTRTH